MSNEQLRCDPDTCPPGALFDCDYVFGSPIVIPVREGGTLIQWNLDPQVRDLGEYQFTLQFGNAGVPDPAAWRNVTSQTDAYFLVDPRRRLPGVYSFTHYRLKLTTGERTYYSRPLHTMGNLPYADWRIYVSKLRAAHVQLASNTGIKGLLYKRKISGAPCRKCVDFNTGEVTNSFCSVCYGTGWVGGYYKPIPCHWFNVLPADATIKYDTQTQGPMTNTTLAATSIASPLLIVGDIWINLQNSERFKIVQTNPVEEVKGIPVIYQLAIDRLPFSDIAHKLSIDV